MPEPPAGEADLRSLARRFEDAARQVRALVAQAPEGNRRELLARALAILIALRQEDLRRPVVAAYVAAFTTARNGGELREPKDLARSLHIRLDRGAQTAGDNASAVFKRATADNLDDVAHEAVTAHIDDRGARWTLGSWASMTTQTIGRQATSRGLAHAIGEGGGVTIHVGKCGWCQSHAGQGRIGEIALPPYHPSCSCVATPA